MSLTDKQINDMLTHDPVAAAEKDFGTYSIGAGEVALAYAIEHNASKGKMLDEIGDSSMRTKLDRYVPIIESIGFRLALTIDFDAPDMERPRKEQQFFYVSEDGILLIFDTYGGNSVNGGSFYYSWKPHPSYMDNEGRDSSVLSSGQFIAPSGWPEDRHAPLPTDAYWIGSHDCREAIKFHVGQLRKYGTFVHPWPNGHDRHVWCCHHADFSNPHGKHWYDQYDYKTAEYEQVIVNAQDRLKQLPQWALDILGPELHHLY